MPGLADLLSTAVAMRPDDPAFAMRSGEPNFLKYLPQDWRTEGWRTPGNQVPDYMLPPDNAPSAPPVGGPLFPPPRELMHPPGPPMGVPLEGRTRFPDDVTRMMENRKLDLMQKGPVPGGPSYLEHMLGVPGERERLPPRRYGPGQLI